MGAKITFSGTDELPFTGWPIRGYAVPFPVFGATMKKAADGGSQLVWTNLWRALLIREVSLAIYISLDSRIMFFMAWSLEMP